VRCSFVGDNEQRYLSIDRSISLSINQPKHIYIAPYVAKESEAHADFSEKILKIGQHLGKIWTKV